MRRANNVPFLEKMTAVRTIPYLTVVRESRIVLCDT